MTDLIDVRDLTGAAYASAKAKAERPLKYVAPPVLPLRSATDMSPEEFEASRPKRVADMSAAEYAVALAAVIKAGRG